MLRLTKIDHHTLALQDLGAMKNRTIKLLRVVGSPFVSGKESPANAYEASELYDCAIKNRMAFFFLTELRKSFELGKLKNAYTLMYAKYLGTYDAILRASNVLTMVNVDHAIFKTIRPYPSTTVDIDILVFGPDDFHKKAIDSMGDAGYIRLGSGPHSMTFRDPAVDIGVDLYREVSVSHIIYLDKDLLKPYVTQKRLLLQGPRTVSVLSPAADLVALIAHSVIKEHMYTLSEYYSTLHYLGEMSPDELSGFQKMIYENNIVSTVVVHMGITARLHEIAHGYVPEKIKEFVGGLQVKSIEGQRFERSLKFPYKFHPLTVLRALIEKITGEEKTRRSVAKQIIGMSQPNFAGSVVRKIVEHTWRETY